MLAENSGLKCPDTFRFRIGDQPRDQLFSDSAFPGHLRDVDADFRDPGIHRPLRHGTQCGPADDFLRCPRNHPADSQVPFVPFLPFGSRLLKRFVSGCNAFKINGTHGRPMIASHGFEYYRPIHAAIIETTWRWIETIAEIRRIRKCATSRNAL